MLCCGPGSQSWWNRKGPSHKAQHCKKISWYAKSLRFLNTETEVSLSLSPSHYSVCVFVLRTHTLPEVWVFLRLEWALNPYAVPGTVCHGLALPVTPPVLAQSSARDDPVPASPLLPLALLLTQTNKLIYNSPEETGVRKDWLCFL